MAPPGYPKITSTPSATRLSITIWAPVSFFMDSYTSRSLICRDQRRLHHYHNAAQRACGSLPFKPSRARRALDVRQRSTSLETRKAHSTEREDQKLRSKRMSPKRTSLPLETIIDPCTG